MQPMQAIPQLERAVIQTTSIIYIINEKFERESGGLRSQAMQLENPAKAGIHARIRQDRLSRAPAQLIFQQKVNNNLIKGLASITGPGKALSGNELPKSYFLQQQEKRSAAHRPQRPQHCKPTGRKVKLTSLSESEFTRGAAGCPNPHCVLTG